MTFFFSSALNTDLEIEVCFIKSFKIKTSLFCDNNLNNLFCVFDNNSSLSSIIFITFKYLGEYFSEICS